MAGEGNLKAELEPRRSDFKSEGLFEPSQSVFKTIGLKLEIHKAGIGELSATTLYRQSTFFHSKLFDKKLMMAIKKESSANKFVSHSKKRKKKNLSQFSE